MSEHVWISKKLGDSINSPGFYTDLLERDEGHGFECNDRNNIGETLSADCFPKKAWLIEEDAHRRDISPFGAAGSFHYMSEQCANIFRQFDLGGGGLYPVELLEADRITPLPDKWFCLNFGNVKPTILPEKCTDVRPAPKGKVSTFAGFGDDALVFGPGAGTGSDLWIDPKLNHCFLLSDRLTSAVRNSGLSDYFEPLKRGRIVA